MKSLRLVALLFMFTAFVFTACKKEADPIDTTPPVIALVGNNPMVIAQGFVYTEPGYTAIDDFDGDITHLVETHNDIDKDVEGFYTVYYSVSDKAGNKADTTRTVEVMAF